jgi:hypothetical protein
MVWSGLGDLCQSAAMRWARVVVIAAPAVVLAGLGLTHPQDLTATSAPWWTTLHVLLLPLFPLLALSLWLLLRGLPGPAAWVARIAAYGYAAFYTALDVLAGIAAGELTQLNAERGLQTDAVEVDRLFAVGNDLGDIGVWCFGIACVATALAVVGRVGRRALPGAVVLVAAAVVFVAGGVHIYWPWGVGTMLALAVGLALLATVLPDPQPRDSQTTEERGQSSEPAAT